MVIFRLSGFYWIWSLCSCSPNYQGDHTRKPKQFKVLPLAWRDVNYPEGPSTQYLRTLVPKSIPAIPLMAFGTRVLKYWVLGLGPSGLGPLMFSRSAPHPPSLPRRSRRPRHWPTKSLAQVVSDGLETQMSPEIM